jgi:dolichyl-phosphate-mannose-protein mannosyltransferase
MARMSTLVRGRLRPPPTVDRAGPAGGPRAWAAILAVTVLGGVLRFWHLGRPHSLVFDETYYVKQGVSMLKFGYEQHWAGGTEAAATDKKFAAGDWNVFDGTPDFVVHPPVGKWMIAFGEHLFGPDSSAGWRFSSALAGTLSILMLTLIARRLFASTLLGVVAGLLLSVDGQHFVHSRTGLLDIFVMFWALAAFGCLLIDRDHGRARLAARLARDGRTRRFGPGLGLRPWRVAGAVCLGLCIGTKWSGLYVAAAFGLMIVLWDVGARRGAGIRHWFVGGVLRDGVTGALVMLPVAAGVYLASWTGWLRSSGGYGRQWAQQHPSDSVVPDALRSLWHYHADMYGFHIGLSTPHPYEANPWSWIVLGRPTAFYYQEATRGQGGCAVAKCSEAITALGNPVIWWGGTLAVGVLLFRWALSRDWRAGAVLAGLLAGYLPWFLYQHRTIFNFYSVVFTPWVVLGLVYVLGLALGPPGPPGPPGPLTGRRRAGVLLGGAVVLGAVLLFWFFLPVLSAETIPWSGWRDRMWFPSWI